MKRTDIRLTILALLFSLALVSCDAMYSKNLFAGMTHKKPSAADIAAKTPDELKSFVSSKVNMEMLASEPELKEAALTSLGYGSGQAAPPPATTAEAQTSAIVAADIAISTVPEAAEFSSSVLGYLTDTASSSGMPTTTTDVTNMISTILPADIQSSIGDPTPPQAFLDMVEAYSTANAAYLALGSGIAADSSAAASFSGLGSAATSEIAVNAVIAGIIDAITPAGVTGPATVEQKAEALWAALNDPSLLENIATAPFTISADAVDNMTSSTGTSPIASLVSASGLGGLLSSSAAPTGGQP